MSAEKLIEKCVVELQQAADRIATLEAALEEAMDIYQADDMSDIGEAMFMVLHAARTASGAI